MQDEWKSEDSLNLGEADRTDVVEDSKGMVHVAGRKSRSPSIIFFMQCGGQ